MIVRGSCHCGNIKLRLVTDRDLEHLNPRRCPCEFCRMHGAVYVADARGRARLELEDPEAVVRYRFGEMTTEYLTCRICGSFAGALLTAGGARYSALNINLTEHLGLPAAEDCAWREQSAEQRIAARMARWTPTTVV